MLDTITSSGRMAGKYAVVTGGNSGIGAATVRLFVEEGASGVAILDLQRPDKDFFALAKELGGGVTAIACDVTDSASVDAAFAKAHEAFGRIDVLVCSAGVLDNNNSVPRTDDELWDSVVGINQTGIFYSCRAALRYMEKQGKGSIVNISSVAGVSGNSGAAYSASKHAVMSISRNIAIQYCAGDIRCNTICPGPTVTPMTSGEIERDEIGLPLDPSFDREFTFKCRQHIDGSVPICEAVDQARAILFFASDEARYVTGQWIQVDHGFY